MELQEAIRLLQHAMFYLCAVQYLALKEPHTPIVKEREWEHGDYSAIVMLADHIARLRGKK